ncbi:BTAD domain-containing putative transcriptional regulator [Agromyces bauzanensis]
MDNAKDPTPLAVELLGRIVVRIDGADVHLRGEIARGVIGRLALAAGDAVSTEDLVRSLWAEPTDTAAVSVRVNVSKLRGGPLGPWLTGGGYRLDVDPAQVDLLRLRAAIRELRAAVASGLPDPDLLERLDFADLLWGGEPLTELVDQPFAMELRADLAEERRFAGQGLAALHVDRGDFQTALAGIAVLRSRTPLAEEPVRLEALALAGAGRTSEALAAIDAFRDLLADELGLELPPALAELRQSVLRADPVVTASARRRVDVERHGIPLPLTRLVGRLDVLDAIAEARTNARLVTLVGPGGVGKTRLAVESARRAGRELDEVQWMVDLAAVPDGAGVVGAAADAVGATSHEPDAIVRRLDGRRALLVLDNAEHVLDDCRALARRLLEQCEGLGVLVTSREPLGIPGERLVRVEPLAGAAADDAVELFAERAQDARPGFTVDDANRDEVRALCAALDGMPLALELAAARLGVMELGQLAQSVLGSAAGAAATAAGSAAPRGERHASLIAAIGWSVDLLDDAERELLSQVARFAGTFDFADVAAVCTVHGDEPVAVAVRLAQQSLLSVVDREGRQRRYRMLESVKAYVRARHPLTETAAAAWTARHAAWYADLADRLGPEVRGHGRHAARDELIAAAPDLRLALDTAVARGDRETALRIAGGQAEHWMREGRLVDGRAEVDRALAVPGEADPAVEARALLGVALLAFQSGGFEAALPYADPAFAAAEAAGDIDRQAVLLGYTAYGRSLRGDREAAEALVAQAEALLGAVAPWVRCSVLLCVGQALRTLGRPAQALEALRSARAVAVRTGYEWIASSATYVTGKVLVDVRRGRDAIAVLVPGVGEALDEGHPTSALALAHLVGGACALIERHYDGAVIFAAVDRLGARYDYNPVVAEGADAEVHRRRIAEALTPRERVQAVAMGSALDLTGLLDFASALPVRAAA